MQGIRGQVVSVQCLDATDQFVDRCLWVFDKRPTRGDDDVGLERGDFSQAGDQLCQATSVPVISTYRRFRNGLLKAVKIKELSVAINEIASKGKLLSIDRGQIRDRPWSVARRIDDFELESAPVDGLRFFDPTLNINWLCNDLGGKATTTEFTKAVIDSLK